MTIAISGEFGDGLEQFVYYKVENGSVRERETAFTPPGGADALVRQFIGLEIDLLIAGNLPETLKIALSDAGIPVISRVTGKADSILKSYLDGTLKF